MSVVVRKTLMLMIVALYPASSHQEIQSSLLMSVIAASLIGQLYLKPYRNDHIGGKLEFLETASLTAGLAGHTLGAYVTATRTRVAESVSIGMNPGGDSIADIATYAFLLVAVAYTYAFFRAFHDAINWELYGGPPDPVDPDNIRHVQLRQFQRDCHDEVSEDSDDDDEGEEARLEAYRLAHRPPLEAGELFYPEEKAEVDYQKDKWKPEMSQSKNDPRSFLDTALGAECFHEIDIEMTEISINPLSETQSLDLADEAPIEVIEIDREMKAQKREKKDKRKERKDKKERKEDKTERRASKSERSEKSDRKSDKPKKGDTVARARVERALERRSRHRKSDKSDPGDRESPH